MANGDEKRGRGRPPKEDTEGAIERALEATQGSLDRLCLGIVDRPGSNFAGLLVRCARAGVPQETAEKAMAALESAVADARKAMVRGYADPHGKPVRPKGRVQLSA